MTKARKKNSKKTSPVFLSDNQAAHEAPDNPLDPPPVVGLGDMSYSSVARRRSERLRPVLPETLDNDDMSNRVSPGFDLEEPEVGRTSDRNERSVRNSGSQRKSSNSTPIPGIEESRSSPIRASRRSRESRSPTNDGNQSGSEQRSMKLQMLELEARLASERLKQAQEEFEEERSNLRSPDNRGSRRSHHNSGDEHSRHSKVSDENIREAMRNLHMPTRRANESRDEYNSRLAASLRLRKEQEEREKAERRDLQRQRELRDEAEMLRREQEEYNTEQLRREKESETIRKPSERLRKAAQPSDAAIRRQEHYREWLATQNILDQMRESDLRAEGRTNIPSRDKRAAYGGYPRSDTSGRNATAGPSGLNGGRRGGDGREDNDDHRNDQRNDHSNNSRRHSSRDHRSGGNDPSEPSDDSSSDRSYRPRGSPTTPSSSTDEDRSSRRNRRSRGQSSRHSRRTNDRNRRKRRRRDDDGPSEPSDSSDDDHDGRSHRSSDRRRRRDERRHQDRRSRRHGTRSTRTRGFTRERSYRPRDPESDSEDMDEDDIHENNYEAEILRRYRWLIRDRIGQEREAHPDIKNIKVSPPEKYAGEDDIEVFDTWLAGLLRWLRVYNITGDAKDATRVDLCGTTLTGLAATWYADEVEAWNRRVQVWYFEDLVCEMYKRFIHEVTAQNAATSYQKTKFTRSKGALAFYNELQRHASRMVQPPDKYSMKRKFLKGLPEDIVEGLLKARRVSAEHTSMAKILREVKAMESSIQAYHNYKSERQERSSVQRTTTSTTPQNTTTRTPRVVRFVKRTSGNYQSGNFQKDKTDANHSGSKPNYRGPSGYTANNRDKGARQSTPRPGGNNKSGTADRGRDSSDVECYLCHQKGHYARDCPKRPRVFAAQVIDEDAEPAPLPEDTDDEREEPRSHEDGPESDHPSNPNGSQYDSEQEGNPLDEYEEYVEVEDYNDEDEDVVYIRAMNTDDTEGDEAANSFIVDALIRDDIAGALGINDDTDTSSISDSASTLVGRADSSMNLMDIPRDMTPYEMLISLSDDARIEIFTMRMLEEDPTWIPRRVETTEGSNLLSPPPELLQSYGYGIQEQIYDCDWIERLAVTDPYKFGELTGYRVPTQQLCEHCGHCTPEVQEVMFDGGDGAVYTRTVMRCRTDTSRVSIRAITDAEEPPRAYRYRMVRPVGLITRPIREDGEDLCLAAYVKINGVKAYTLFDSGSTTDAVSPDFTRIAKLSVKELDKPVTLQLGCSGSRSKVNFATEAKVEFASINIGTYLDIANLDKYDSILGTPFLRKHGISLDFETQEIVIRGKLRIPALIEGEGTTAAKPIRRGK